MTELTLHGRDVHTVFDLLGHDENDITYSLGWALANSGRLARSLLSEAFQSDPGELTAIRLQQALPGAGRTDVEIESQCLHLIIEAKRGWNLPEPTQLALYAPRFKSGREAAILVVSEGSREFAAPRLESEVDGVRVHYLPWSQIARLVQQTSSGSGVRQAERRLLGELVRYLRGLMTMQNVTSNMVYVVSLGLKKLADPGLSTIEILLKYDRYFCPVGGGRGGWPKTPPNYLGFRFNGKLQQIRHVEDYEIQMAPWDDIPELAGRVDQPEHQQFVYELGPVIETPHEVKTGNLFRAQRVWAALDLLLTSSTIREARDKTRERLAAAGEA